MAKRTLNPGCMLAPVPAALVSCADAEGNTNLITIAWTGTINTKPPMVYISVRPGRHSYRMIKESGEFVINLITEDMVRGTDLCGVKSGKDVDKWSLTGFTPAPASKVKAPLVEESPLNLECKVKEIIPLGSHHMFIADVVAVDAQESLFDEKDALDLNRAKLAGFVHGAYVSLGEVKGTFGYSVRKKPMEKKFPEKKTAEKRSAQKKPVQKKSGQKNTSQKKRPTEKRVSKNKNDR